LAAGVALVFSQPALTRACRLVRRAETPLLERLTRGLALTVAAPERNDDELAEQGIAALRELAEDVTELRRTTRLGVRRWPLGSLGYAWSRPT
jgi:hypothetical protein